MSGAELLVQLARLCRDVDRGFRPARIAFKGLAVPVAVGLSFGLGGCTTDERDVDEGCTDGLDNDGDGDADCADEDCFEDIACRPMPAYGPAFEECSNGYDDDGDGLIDCEDTDCSSDVNCASTPDYGAPFTDEYDEE